LGLLKLVEFISQEKKKSNPSVANNSQGTDQYLPDQLPKRGDAPTVETPATGPVATAAPVEDSSAIKEPKHTPTLDQQPAAHKETPTTPPQTAESKIVSDHELPEERPLPDAPVAAPQPVDPAGAFDAPNPTTAAGTTGRRRRRSGSSGLSLKAAMNEMESTKNDSQTKVEEHEQEAAEVVQQEGPQSVFTANELKMAIEVYVKQRHVKTAVRSMLMAQVPTILDKNTLEIELDNNIQLGFFKEEQKELVPYLREKLNNFALRFEIKMVESKQVRKLYLPEEKFQHMVEKNPSLLYLRQKLNTDLE